MAKYVDLVLTADGFFCVAPSWSVNEGDYVTMVNPLTGVNELKKVIAIATDNVDGDFINMVRAYIGCEPCKVTQRYRGTDVFWEGEENVSER